MSSTLQNYSALAGRIFIALIFIISGTGKVGSFDSTAAYMSAHGMPMSSLFLSGAIIFELMGGLSLLFGYKTHYGVMMLALFLIPATLIFHPFWSVPPEAYRLQMIMFLKNIAILGGLLTVLAHGPGKFSVDDQINSR